MSAPSTMTVLYLCTLYVLFSSCFAAETSTTPCPTRHPNSNHAKVLILGAGAAGLQAAKYLYNNGEVDFIIVEGADYIGGRVHNVQFGGVNVELGANWAQPGGTAIVEQVKALGIETHLSNFDSLIIRNSTGYDVTEEADSRWDAIEIAMERTRKIARDIEENNKPDMSQRSALRLGDWVPKTAIDHAIEYFLYDFEWAAIPAVTSLRSTALLPYDDEILFVKDTRGFQLIFDDIVSILKANECMNHIRLNQTVSTVDQSSEDEVQVTCHDGTVYTGDYVLVTFGLGVMQDDLVEFIPPLPDWKIEELYQFIMTSFTKIFLKWPSKFWSDEEWIIHANERSCGYYPLFLNLEANGLMPSGTNILVAFVTSDEARRIEYQSDGETKVQIEEVLRDMYGADAVPDAEEILISGWNRNPLHRGAYSNWPVEVSADCFLKIQARVDRLLFGGEHTDVKYNGYVFGAQQSGEREAQKILQCLDGKCPEPMFGSASSVSYTLASTLLAALVAILI